MTRRMRGGLWLALAHVLIVASVAGKYLLDRQTRPRAWARTAPFDPDLPIRGRYVQLRVEALAGEGIDVNRIAVTRVVLAERNGELVATPAADNAGIPATTVRRGDRQVVVLSEPVAYFIPEHVDDPSNRPPGDPLWVEVTLPSSGPPRPVQLGIARDGRITPLDVR